MRIQLRGGEIESINLVTKCYSRSMTSYVYNFQIKKRLWLLRQAGNTKTQVAGWQGKSKHFIPVVSFACSTLFGFNRLKTYIFFFFFSESCLASIGMHSRLESSWPQLKLSIVEASTTLYIFAFSMVDLLSAHRSAIECPAPYSMRFLT